MKLEVEMYVRTDNGIIGKIYEKIGDMFTYKDSNRDYITYGLLHTEIIKASHNIIDLIQKGDYVNGLKVMEVREHLHNDVEIVLSNGEFHWSFSKNESDYKIKSIVTKEQFESMSYKVGE